jgi:hypothetical protein
VGCSTGRVHDEIGTGTEAAAGGGRGEVQMSMPIEHENL